MYQDNLCIKRFTSLFRPYLQWWRIFSSPIWIKTTYPESVLGKRFQTCKFICVIWEPKYSNERKCKIWDWKTKQLMRFQQQFSEKLEIVLLLKRNILSFFFLHINTAICGYLSLQYFFRLHRHLSSPKRAAFIATYIDNVTDHSFIM